MTGAPQRRTGVTHPPWCLPQRCEFLLPAAQLGQALPRHKGPLRTIGDRRDGGAVVVYLFARRAGLPMLGIHSTARFLGSGGAVLRLVDAWQLARHLDGLLTAAEFTPPQGGTDDRT